MKNFFKKLAFVLALALVVTSIAPAVQASAAAAPVLNTTGKKLYIGGDVSGDYSDTFTLKVWNKGSYKVSFASGNTKVATVSKTTGKVTAVAVGNTTITATVTNAKTKKTVKKLTAKVWVKKNATEVGFSTASKAKFDKPLVVGDSAKLNVYRKDNNGNVVWKQADKTTISDYIKWTSSNPSVAKVTKWGTVVAVSAGEATITAVAKQTEGYLSTTEPATVKVVVNEKGITGVTQTSSKEIKVTFGTAQDATKVTKDTLVVTPADASVAAPYVKSVEFDKELKVATVKFYTDLTDKAAYTVTVTDTDYTGEFVASVGEVATITITDPATVVENNITELKYVLKDANGVEVLPDGDSRVEFSVVENETNGYTGSFVNSDNETVDGVCVYEDGKTVALKAVYYTGDYDKDGNEISITSNVFVVTGIDIKDSSISSTLYTITDESEATNDADDIDWDNLKQNLQVELDNYAYRIEAKVKDTTGKEYLTTSSDVYTNFKFESLDKTIVGVGSDGTITPIKKGTAMIKVSLVDSEKSFVIKVTVTSKAVITSFVLDNSKLTVSSKGSAVDDVATFKATFKDQYGNKKTVNLGTSPYVSVVANNDTAKKNPLGYTGSDNKIVFDPSTSGTPAGTYQYKVTYKDDDTELTRVITIVVTDPSTTGNGYDKLVLSTNNVDMAVNNDNDGSKTVEISFYDYASNNIKEKKYDLNSSNYSVTVTKNNGTPVAFTVDGQSLVVKVNTVSNAAIATTGGSIVKELKGETGTYTVTLVDNSTSTAKTYKQVFIVKDTQIVPVITRKATSVSSSDDLEDAFSVKTSNSSEEVKLVGFEYREIGDKTNKVYTVNGLALPPSTSIVITKILVKETFNTNDNYYIHDVDTSFYLTIK